MMKIYISSNRDEVYRDDLDRLAKLFNTLDIEYSVSNNLEAYGYKESFEADSSDYILVIGGDRILLETLLKVRGRGPIVIPVSGRSSGGFFTLYSFRDIPYIITNVIKGRFRVKSLNRLSAYIGGLELPPVFNDIVVTHSIPGKLVRYSLYINGEFVWRDTADGVVVSTPMGSTGYSLSAGGPIVKDADVMVISPLNTLNPSHKPIVTDLDSEVLISDLSTDKYIAIVDGQMRLAIKAEQVRIVKSMYPVKMLEDVVRASRGLYDRLSMRDYNHIDYEIFSALPPSAKFIYRVLGYEGALTFSELASKTALPERTLRHALKTLIDKGLVKKVYMDKDARIAIYRLNI